MGTVAGGDEGEDTGRPDGVSGVRTGSPAMAALASGQRGPGQG